MFQGSGDAQSRRIQLWLWECNCTLHKHISIPCETLTIILLIVLLTEVVMVAKFGEDVHTWYTNFFYTVTLQVYSICMHGTTNQGHRLFERSHSPLQFPSVLLCILVGLDFCLSGAILVTAHIQVTKIFQMRNYPLGSSWSMTEINSLLNLASFPGH